MRTWTKGLIALALIAATTGVAEAQRPGGGGGRGFGGGMGMGMGGATLAAMPPVQDELKITDEQSSKVETIAAEVREAMGGLRDRFANLDPAERMEKARELMTEANDKAKAKLAEVLDEGQMARLEQIELQVQGVQAFASAKVHEALEITDEQKTKLEGLLADVADKQRTIMQDAQGDFASAMGKVRELREESMAKAKELLDEAQTSKWGELVGEPFEMPAFGPGGGSGRRGGN